MFQDDYHSFIVVPFRETLQQPILDKQRELLKSIGIPDDIVETLDQ